MKNVTVVPLAQSTTDDDGPSAKSTTVDDGRLAKLTLSGDTANPDLIRGVPLGAMLAAMGALLQAPPAGSQFTQKETEHLYDLSKAGDLRGFLSHSWRDGRWRKYFSLLLLYNGNLAVAVSSALFLPVVLAEIYGVLPLPTVQFERTNGKGTSITGSVHIIFFMWCSLWFSFSGTFSIPEIKYFWTNVA